MIVSIRVVRVATVSIAIALLTPARPAFVAPVCPTLSGLWGDVTSDNTVNIVDAQQVARWSVGLSVLDTAAVSSRGDVNADNTVNIIDAQQIARYSVSLSAAPLINTGLSGSPLVATLAVNPATISTILIGGTVQALATPRDAGGADLTGCSGVTWSSSDPTVAVVSSSGLVTGMAAGSATITATAMTSPTVHSSAGVITLGNGQPVVTTLFSANDGPYASFRIPALMRTSHGTLLAFAEGRVGDGDDTGDIDVVFRRSVDGGVTWSARAIVCDMGPDTCGNPAVVEDRDTGVLWLFLSWNDGRDVETDFVFGTGHDTRRAFLSHSVDDGATWSTPVDVTSSVKSPAMGWYGTGPGAGIQIQSGPHQGRLVVPGDHTIADPAGDADGGPYDFGGHAIISDDHGATWYLSGLVHSKIAEPSIAEIPGSSGQILMNARAMAGRNIRSQSYSADGGVSWTAPTDGIGLIEPECEGSLVRALTAGDAEILLFANPASLVRENLVVRRSTDGGATWSSGLTLHAGPSAYSSMAALPVGMVGVLFESGESSPYERIDFVRLPLSIIP